MGEIDELAFYRAALMGQRVRLIGPASVVYGEVVGCVVDVCRQVYQSRPMYQIDIKVEWMGMGTQSRAALFSPQDVEVIDGT